MSLQGFSKPSHTMAIFAANTFNPNFVSSYLSASGVWFEHSIGSYEGNIENSWIVKLSDLYKFTFLLEKEESILVLSSPNSRTQYKAKLVFLDEETPDQDLGYFRHVPEKEAKKQDAWTCRMVYNSYAGRIEAWYWVCYFNDIFGEPIYGQV